MDAQNKSSANNRSYSHRAWAVFKHDAWAWAKNNILVSIFVVLAAPVAMFLRSGLKPDYQVLWGSVAAYGVVVLIYCVIQAVQIPAKLDKERAREETERETETATLRSEIATLKAATSNVENSIADPFLCLLHERQRLESELQPLLEVEECGIKVIPAIKIGKDESDFRREKITHLKRDIETINSEIEVQRRKQPSTLPAEWKELADRFAATTQFVRADWQHGGMGKNGDEVIETWRFAGDWNGEKNVEPLCRLAGKMLARSPNVLAGASGQAAAERDDVRRWLYFLKHRGAFSLDRGYGIVEGTGKIIMLGSINNVADASRIACIHCAAEES